MPNGGLGSPLSMCDHRGQIRTNTQTSWLYAWSNNIHEGDNLCLQPSFLCCAHSAKVWWINTEDLLDTFNCSERDATRKSSLFQHLRYAYVLAILHDGLMLIIAHWVTLNILASKFCIFMTLWTQYAYIKERQQLHSEKYISFCISVLMVWPTCLKMSVNS